MKKIICAALLAGLAATAAAPAMAGIGISLDFGDVAIGYSDGYYDSHHHWHHWRHNGDFDKWNHDHPGAGHNWRHDDHHHHDDGHH